MSQQFFLMKGSYRLFRLVTWLNLLLLIHGMLALSKLSLAQVRPSSSSLPFQSHPQAREPGPPGRSPSEPGKPGEVICKNTRGENSSDAVVAVVQSVPLPGRNDVVFRGVTASERPRFWFYVPYQPHPKLKATFTLKQKTGERQTSTSVVPIYTERYKTTIPLTANLPGLVGVPIPAGKPGLTTIGEDYRWEFSMDCATPEASALETRQVYGLARRVAISSQVRAGLGNSKPLRERIQNAARAGLFYETLTGIYDLRCSDYNTAQQLLRNLLTHETVRLGNLVDAPLLNRSQCASRPPRR
jgi:hypothetical protein